MLGEALNFLIPLPVPAGVYGLALLFGALCLGLVKLPSVEGAGGFLLEAMPLMFIPAAVGLTEEYHNLLPVLHKVVLIVVLSTVVVMAVSGRAAQAVLSFRRRKRG